jgi:hypothetical protein
LAFGSANVDEHEGLFFHGPDGRPQLVSTAALEETLRAAGGSVSLVVLSACYSKAQADVLVAHVACVVGMRGPIRDTAARAFAIGFYGGLGEGEPVALAFRQGLAAIRLQSPADGSTAGEVADKAAEECLHLPMLWASPGVDPNSLRIVPKHSTRTRCSIVIKANLRDFDATLIARVREQLRLLTGDVSLEIVEVSEGSVKLTVSLSSNAAVHLKQMSDNEKLDLICGFDVSSVEADGQAIEEPAASESIPMARMHVRAHESAITTPVGMANFVGSKLHGAKLHRVNLANADFSGADLATAELCDASFAGAKLTGANLTGSVLTGVNLTGADLTGTDLTGANLTGAVVTGVHYDETTRWPQGFVPPTISDKEPKNVGENATPDGPLQAETTVLFLAANPRERPVLELGEECRAIEDKIRAARFREKLRFRSRWAMRLDDLVQALYEDTPSVLHFSGHGAEAQGLWLATEDTGVIRANSDGLGQVIRAAGDGVRLVVLNACYTKVQAEALVVHVPCVIGMPSAIGDKSAIVYAAELYRALAFGKSIANAHQCGLAALALHSSMGSPGDAGSVRGINVAKAISNTTPPELLVRAGVDPSHVHVVQPGS